MKNNKIEMKNDYFNKIVDAIKNSKNNVLTVVNHELIILYWNIGKIIKVDILKGEKPSYGKNEIEKISIGLVSEYGRGYSYRNLLNMLKLFEVFGDESILHTVCAKLTLYNSYLYLK